MMNRFRKILSAALASCMAVSALMMSAGAANIGTEAAREKVIYGSQAWTVNGAVTIQHSDGTVEPVPEFSDRKSTRLNSSHIPLSRMPSSA